MSNELKLKLEAGCERILYIYPYVAVWPLQDIANILLQ